MLLDYYLNLFNRKRIFFNAFVQNNYKMFIVTDLF